MPVAACFHTYVDVHTLTEAVAWQIETACRDALHARGHAWLALAGGRTPLPIYARLAHSALPGPIEAIPTDERCVPHTHPACNLHHLRAALSSHPALHVHALTAADGDPEASLAQTRTLLSAHPEPFTAVLLGMGADGHIASLFPGAANLQEGLALDSSLDAIATLPDPLPPEAPFARISLTLPRLLRADGVHLVATGQEKGDLLRRVQQSPHSSPPPVAALLCTAATIHIHWSP